MPLVVLDLAAPTYPHDIQSIRDVHPNLPVILGNLDLNRRIQANTPVDRAGLVHAQEVAKILKEIKGGSRFRWFCAFTCLNFLHAAQKYEMSLW
jgi:hypothetical protein